MRPSCSSCGTRCDAGRPRDQERELFDTTLRDGWRSRTVSRQSCRRRVMRNPFGLGDQPVRCARHPGPRRHRWPGWRRACCGWRGLARRSAPSARWPALRARARACWGRPPIRSGCKSSGMGLGAAGGIAGGIGGLANLWRHRRQSLSDAARLASNAGRVVGGVVAAVADNDALKQAGGYLGRQARPGAVSIRCSRR